jgi:hypothetical protein
VLPLGRYLLPSARNSVAGGLQNRPAGVLDLLPASIYNIPYTIYVPYVIFPHVDRSRQNAEVAMFEDKTKVLLLIPQGVLDQARGFAGEATSKLKRPVSLQMELRTLIDEGLKREGDRAVVANIEGQVQAVRL